jgi:cytochrome bd ubiquinol oxidase subunit II
MILLQGATWLAVKTDMAVQRRARQAIMIFSMLTPILFIMAGLWVATGIQGYRFVSVADPYGPSNPLHKTVIRAAGAWMDNYNKMPVSVLAPLMAAAGAGMALWGMAVRKHRIAFIGSSLVQMGVIATAGVSMFPFLLPSSLDPDASLTIWDASSSRTTLAIMALVTAVFLPVVIAYTAWVYHVLRGKVTAAHVKEHGDNLY